MLLIAVKLVEKEKKFRLRYTVLYVHWVGTFWLCLISPRLVLVGMIYTHVCTHMYYLLPDLTT